MAEETRQNPETTQAAQPGAAAETPQPKAAPKTKQAKALKMPRMPGKPKASKQSKDQGAKKSDRARSLSWLWSGGVLLEQHKDPVLSQEVVQFIDPERQRVIPELLPWNDISEISPEDIIQVARLARIVDERDGYPLFRKLRRCQGRRVTVLVDALDEEPYVSSQLGPLLHMSEECISGLTLACKSVRAEESAILVYQGITDLEVKIPRTIGGVPVQRVWGKYPSELLSAHSLVEGKDGRVTLYVGSCGLIHLHRAVFEARMQSTSFITVAGNCVANPCNMEVSLDTTATQVLDFCGLEVSPTRVVVGGSVTGESVPDTDQVPVRATTRAILAFQEDERDKRYQCLNCGRCTEVCPMGLNPRSLYKGIGRSLHDQVAELDYKMCVGCMCCSYVCPAKLDIAGRIAWYRRSRKEAPT